MHEASNSPVIYHIDDEDRIVHVDGDWDRFAMENRGDAVHSSRILNRPLWDYIQDQTTRELYRQMLTRIRSGHFACFEFRCDSPECRRRLEMRIKPGPNNRVEFFVNTLALEPRPTVPLLDPEYPRTQEMLRVCGWCKKINMEGNWQDIEDAMQQFPLFNEPSLPSMTHGICEDCYLKMTESLKDMNKAG